MQLILCEDTNWYVADDGALQKEMFIIAGGEDPSHWLLDHAYGGHHILERYDLSRNGDSVGSLLSGGFAGEQFVHISQ